MKLLIDIPEHIYEHAKETTEDSRDEFDAMRAIANGSPQESCGDAISRQAVLDMLNDIDAEVHGGCGFMYNHWMDYIEQLPSVTPQQRTGRWIEVIDETDSLGNKTWHHECSICGSDKSGWGTYKHCPDCGAKMEVSGCTKNI